MRRMQAGNEKSDPEQQEDAPLNDAQRTRRHSVNEFQVVRKRDQEDAAGRSRKVDGSSPLGHPVEHYSFPNCRAALAGGGPGGLFLLCFGVKGAPLITIFYRASSSGDTGASP